MRIACDVSATQLDDMFEMIDLLNDIVIKPCLYTRTVNCPLTTQERFHVVNAFSVEGIEIIKNASAFIRTRANLAQNYDICKYY